MICGGDGSGRGRGGKGMVYKMEWEGKRVSDSLCV